jgi:glycosyltransferase involved in cell wall biosynthesis
VTLDARWRAGAERAQEAVLPAGRVVVSSGAPYGVGGLGRHLKEIVDALERREAFPVCISGSTGPTAVGASRSRSRLPGRTAAAAPLARLSPGWRIWKTRVEFDARTARQLPVADHLIAFNRQALAQFHAARRAGYGSVSLMTGSPHVRRVAHQHARAYRQYPLERSFGTHIVRRYLAEYELADRIYVASRYAWESFGEHGVGEDRLAMFPLTPDPRYSCDEDGDEQVHRGEQAHGGQAHGGDLKRGGDARGASASFDIIYVGGLSVAKGVPLLVDAVRRLPHADMRLLLVGNWKTRGMRRFIEAARAADARIVVCPGDPLPHLREARLCVHPTFEDGFAYAPVEALACGVPVLVSEDTGMKDLIDPGRTGLTLPTGDLAALTEAIEAVYRRELLSG